MQDIVKIVELWRRLMLGEYGARTELLKLQNHEELANEQIKIADAFLLAQSNDTGRQTKKHGPMGAGTARKDSGTVS